VYVRVPVKPDHLPSGTDIPAGAKLYLCQYVMHRHPRYFPSPEAFEPTRFAAGVESSLRGVYFPFGDGAHTCIGEAFAIQQGVLVLSALAQRYRFELLPGQTIAPRAGITLAPRHGIRAGLHPRTGGS
jgi:cytochrome P450